MGQPISGERPWRRSRQIIVGAAPAAGADWSVTVPAGELWELRSVFAQLVTSAAVATRGARLVVNDGTAAFLTLPAPATQAASLTGTYTWAPHGPQLALAQANIGFVPELSLMPGWSIASSTAAIDAGDQWTAPRLYVVRTTVRSGDIDLGELPELVVAMGPMAAG